MTTSHSSSRSRRSRAVPALLALVALSAGAITACGDDGGTSGAPEPTTAAGKRGLALVDSNGCQACHTANGKSKTGPTWKDLAGSTVTLEGGEKVTADDAYLAESITDPKAKVVDGYAAIMPPNELDDDQVADVVAYLRELSTEADAPS